MPLQTVTPFPLHGTTVHAAQRPLEQVPLQQSVSALHVAPEPLQVSAMALLPPIMESPNPATRAAKARPRETLPVASFLVSSSNRCCSTVFSSRGAGGILVAAGRIPKNGREV